MCVRKKHKLKNCAQNKGQETSVKGQMEAIEYFSQIEAVKSTVIEDKGQRRLFNDVKKAASCLTCIARLHDDSKSDLVIVRLFKDHLKIGNQIKINLDLIDCIFIDEILGICRFRIFGRSNLITLALGKRKDILAGIEFLLRKRNRFLFHRLPEPIAGAEFVARAETVEIIRNSCPSTDGRPGLNFDFN